MIRLVLINLLLIITPFLVYGAYVLLQKKPETSQEFWKLIPLKKLLVIGFLFMGIFYITQINFGGNIRDGIHHPPTVKDGKIIPGYIEPIEKTDKNKKE